MTPCSTGSSHRSSSDSSPTLMVEWSVAPWRSMLMWIAIGFVVLALAFGSGCGRRAVMIPEGAILRTGSDARIKVWYLVDGEWTESEHVVPVPEGWYLVPPSFVEE